jgi:hypothetical protein
MAESNIKILSIRVDTGTGELQINGVTRSIKEASAATRDFIKSAKDMKETTNDLGSSAGLAGATVNEFGRFISDLPYGITAVTNNISQLGSLFAVLVTKTDGVTNAFKSLFATLRASPALVVLLAFQALVAGIEFFVQQSRKATKSQDDLNTAIGESAVELKIALKVLNDNNVSLEEKESLLLKVNGAYKNVNAELGKNEVLTNASTEAIKLEIQQLQLLAKAQTLVAQAKKLYAELAIAEAKTNEESLNWFYRVALQVTEATLPFEVFAGAVETVGKGFKEIATSGIEKEIDAIIEQLKGIYDKIIKDGPGVAKALDDLSLMLIKSQSEYLGSIDAITEEHQIQILQGLTGLKLEELDIQKKAALDKAKEEGRSSKELLLISESYENRRIALLNVANKEYMDLRKSFNEALELDTQTYSDDKHLDAMLDTLLPPREQVKKRAKAVIDGLAAYQKNRQEVEENGNRAVAKLREEDMLAAIYAAQDLSNAAFGVMDASFQREIDLEQDKTNKINNELKERLANENLSADERRNIQKKIAANDEELRKKQEKIEEKKFKLNKAASIANATINTYLAASAALKDPALSTFQRIASMVAIIGSGLAQVAMIAKQKFVSSQSGLSGTGAGGAGGGAGVQAPDFNIVGQSASNQIAAAVQGQFQQPIKAYVVSKDVSTAQEMDRNIIGSASLG